jgi:hypothetical protein
VAKLVRFIIFLLNLEILKILNYRKLPVNTDLRKKPGNGGQKNGRYTGAPVSVFTGASTLVAALNFQLMLNNTGHSGQLAKLKIALKNS